MKKTDLINEYECGTKWTILGTDYTIIQKENKNIELWNGIELIARLELPDYDVCNWNKDYIFMLRKPDALQIYNVKRNDYCLIILSDDKTILDIRCINDCFGDAKINAITEYGWHDYEYKYHEFDKEEQHYSKSDLIIENDNRSETWKLGNSGFEIVHSLEPNEIYFQENGKVLCSFNSNNMNIDNDYNQNKPLRYVMSFGHRLNIIRVWSIEKNTWLSIWLNNDKSIDSTRCINDIINCDVISIKRDSYTCWDENNLPVRKEYKGEE